MFCRRKCLGGTFEMDHMEYLQECKRNVHSIGKHAYAYMYKFNPIQVASAQWIVSTIIIVVPHLQCCECQPVWWMWQAGPQTEQPQMTDKLLWSYLPLWSNYVGHWIPQCSSYRFDHHSPKVGVWKWVLRTIHSMYLSIILCLQLQHNNEYILKIKGFAWHEVFSVQRRNVQHCLQYTFNTNTKLHSL